MSGDNLVNHGADHFAGFQFIPQVTFAQLAQARNQSTVNVLVFIAKRVVCLGQQGFFATAMVDDLIENFVELKLNVGFRFVAQYAVDQIVAQPEQAPVLGVDRGVTAFVFFFPDQMDEV